jgi:hypothetical protein
MVDASSIEDAEDELSNLLGQLYRLAELVKGDRTKDAFYNALEATDETRAASAALWVRNFDTHEATVTAELRDMYSNYYTDMWWTLAWRQRSALPERPGKYGQRPEHYTRYLAGLPVLDTSRHAFDTLAAMVS